MSLWSGGEARAVPEQRLGTAARRSSLDPSPCGEMDIMCGFEPHVAGSTPAGGTKGSTLDKGRAFVV
jgi:hypothetical protein